MNTAATVFAALFLSCTVHGQIRWSSPPVGIGCTTDLEVKRAPLVDDADGKDCELRPIRAAPVCQGISDRRVADLAEDLKTLSSTGTLVSVRSFGAVGDGVTNDTAAIDKGIAYVVSVGGGALYFPPGAYLFTAPYVIRASNIMLVGSGKATTLRYTGATRGIQIGGGAHNVIVRDLRITTGTTTGGTVAGRGAITVDGDFAATSDVVLKSVFVDTVPTSGISVSGAMSASGVRIVHSCVENVAEHGIYLSGCKMCSIISSHVSNAHQNLTLASTAAAIKVTLGRGLVVDDVNVDAGSTENGVGILVENGESEVVMSNVGVELGADNQSGIRIDADQVSVDNAVVDGGSGFGNAAAVDFRASCVNSVVQNLYVGGSWISAPIKFRTGARGCGIVTAAVLAGPTQGWIVDLGGAISPLVQCVFSSSGNGINLNSSSGASLINNVFLSGIEYRYGTATNYNIVEGGGCWTIQGSRGKVGVPGSR